MEQKTLKYLRIFIPGIVILIGLYPIITDFFFKNLDYSKINAFHFTIITFISIIIGGIYYQLNIQRLITFPSHFFIKRNILNKLQEAIDDDSRKSMLRENDRYMTLFYKIIDSDESLKKKGENVRFNGIFWTSTADITIISLFFGLFYQFHYTLHGFDSESIISTCYIVSFLSLILHIISVVKHINLSNKQLNIIISDSEIKEKLNSYINGKKS